MAEKFIKGKEEIEYKERLKAFMQEINPKLDLKTIEKIKQELIAKRGTE